jgi:hypothetical protein
MLPDAGFTRVICHGYLLLRDVAPRFVVLGSGFMTSTLKINPQQAGNNCGGNEQDDYGQKD